MTPNNLFPKAMIFGEKTENINRISISNTFLLLDIQQKNLAHGYLINNETFTNCEICGPRVMGSGVRAGSIDL